MAPRPTGNGYWFAATDDRCSTFGDAPFGGSGVGLALGQVVDMTTDGEPTLQGQADIPAIRAHLDGLATSAPREVPRFAGS